MYKILQVIILLSAVFLVSVSTAEAQVPEGMGDRYIRVAEMGGACGLRKCLGGCK